MWKDFNNSFTSEMNCKSSEVADFILPTSVVHLYEGIIKIC